MELTAHYNDLWERSIQKIKAENFQVDPLLDSHADNRYGVTLLIRPDAPVKKNIQQFLTDLKTIEPDQYYYRDSDIHITVMSIISCYNGFALEQIEIASYIELIQKSIASAKKTEISFRGITASPSCIMIQGFLHDSTLNNIRDELRNNFKHSSLQQSIDKRYTIQAAHATVVRFRKEVQNKEEFLDRLEKYRDHNFGTFTVNSLELVFNDWYQREEYVKKLFTFELMR